MKVVLATGCFDVLHWGHVAALKEARKLGDYLVVGINSDASIRALKGDGRPINCEAYRTMLLRELRCVDAVQTFEELNTVGILKRVKPQMWAKGGDYDLNKLNQVERRCAESLGVEIVFLPYQHGISTTLIAKKLLDSKGTEPFPMPSLPPDHGMTRRPD